MISRQVESDAILITPSTGKARVINEVGARIWSLMDGVHSVAEIASIIASEYSVEVETALEDTLSFLHTLSTLGIITFLDGEDA